MNIWNDTCLCARRTPSRRTTSTLKAACPSLRSGCRTTSRWWRGSSSALRCCRSVPRTFGCRANASCSRVLRVSNSSCVSSTDLWNLFGSKLSERHRGGAGELVRKRCTHTFHWLAARATLTRACYSLIAILDVRTDSSAPSSWSLQQSERPLLDPLCNICTSKWNDLQTAAVASTCPHIRQYWETVFPSFGTNCVKCE